MRPFLSWAIVNDVELSVKNMHSCAWAEKGGGIFAQDGPMIRMFSLTVARADRKRGLTATVSSRNLFLSIKLVDIVCVG